MKNEKETMITPEAEEAAKKLVADIANDPAPVTDAELDDAFAFEAGDVESDDEAAEVSQGKWKFPGVRVQRTPFVSKGKRMYSYETQMKIGLGVKDADGNERKHILRAEFRVADKKNRDAYEALDLLFLDLPKDQNYLLLGFQYQEYSKSYNYCVQRVFNDIPMIVSLVPRDVLSQNALTSMIAYLQRRGLL